MKSLFIVFEGIDCSGKSTQAQLLKDYFEANNAQAILSPEPSSGPIGNLIREILKNRVFLTKDSQKFDEQMAYLFAADRHDHLYNDVDGVFKLIEQQVHVISTRYYFSSLAYNSHSQEVFEFVSRLNCRFPNPDLLIYIDISVEAALARLSQKRTSLEVYENQAKLARVSKNYQDVLRNYNGLVHKVDGTASTNSIHENIIHFIQNMVNS